MTTPDFTAALPTAAWRTSSYSAATNCVEVATFADSGAAVRDSKNRAGDVLQFNADAWQGFLAGVKAGEFDRA
ncbi:DUF397 domain-containing protein [Pilimelia columellifera]